MLTTPIYQTADRIMVVTLPAARALPGWLGRLAPNMLKYHGYYAVTVDSVRTLYVLQPGEDQ